ncbi:MAG: hypothetical protein NTX03_02480, partial [Bacteroidetes bacterium]|nr:hypothetical protein [Bacteroidota bacterium]
MGNQVSKRLRIFAGPNGSGKTTIINALKNKVKLGVYINADDIENSFSTKGFIDLFAYKIKSDTKEIQDFIRQNSISIYKDTASKIDTY